MNRTPQEQIAVLARQLADLIATEATAALTRIQEAEQEAMRRINVIRSPEYGHQAAAEYLGVSTRTLDRILKAREITYRKHGGRRFFTQAALDAYKADHTIHRRQQRPLPL